MNKALIFLVLVLLGSCTLFTPSEENIDELDYSKIKPISLEKLENNKQKDFLKKINDFKLYTQTFEKKYSDNYRKYTSDDVLISKENLMNTINGLKLLNEDLKIFDKKRLNHLLSITDSNLELIPDNVKQQVKLRIVSNDKLIDFYNVFYNNFDIILFEENEIIISDKEILNLYNNKFGDYQNALNKYILNIQDIQKKSYEDFKKISDEAKSDGLKLLQDNLHDIKLDK